MKFKTVVSSSLCNGIQELQLQQETLLLGRFHPKDHRIQESILGWFGVSVLPCLGMANAYSALQTVKSYSFSATVSR